MALSGQINEEVNRHCVGTAPYRGYKSSYCGDGLILFVGPGGDEVRGTSQERYSWLEPAWRMARTEIDRRVDATGG